MKREITKSRIQVIIDFRKNIPTLVSVVKKANGLVIALPMLASLVMIIVARVNNTIIAIELNLRIKTPIKDIKVTIRKSIHKINKNTQNNQLKIQMIC